MSRVTLSNLTKKFGEVVAVQDFDVEIRQGEFFSLLGPSGCGKTTTLRMIAGFEFPTSGHIRFGERDVTYLKPNRRNAGMVFQNFALFPHLTVFENVAFGLKARRVEKATIPDRVSKALELVDLGGLGSRQVTQLSGGQQQRVALARAIVIEPEILLLDEPMSNLDAKLREETRQEIRKLQQRLGITTIYVTHDQEEALNLSDRIAVLNQGECQQVGTPEDIYRRPTNKFVASFVGNSNILSGRVTMAGTEKVLQLSETWQLHVPPNTLSSFSKGENVWISLRPELVQPVPDGTSGVNVFQGETQSVSFSGAVLDYVVAVDGVSLRGRDLLGQDAFGRTAGTPMTLQVSPDQIHVFAEAED